MHSPSQMRPGSLPQVPIYVFQPQVQDAEKVQPYQGMKGVEYWQPWITGKDGGLDVLHTACLLRVRAH